MAQELVQIKDKVGFEIKRRFVLKFLMEMFLEGVC